VGKSGARVRVRVTVWHSGHSVFCPLPNPMSEYSPISDVGLTLNYTCVPEYE